MGIISYICTFQISLAVAMTGKLAVYTGAWPMPHSRLMGPAPTAPVPPPGAIHYPNEEDAPAPAAREGNA
ncbi:hypothetical protein [Myxococcus hansupus]|uniref:hypothetical protein n=1 Tax=Pseudomyxococcus hansupus TaxID=1297742 RepID=UPI001D037210|nr:hypothetical protein [Myxococcus hansupus]